MSTSGELFRARYGELAPTFDSVLDAQLNPTLTTMLEHHSVRKFLDEPVTDDQLSLIIAGAQSASTSSSLQAWSVIAVRDDAKRARIAQGCGKSGAFITAAPLLLVWTIDFARADNILNAAGVETNSFNLIETTGMGFLDVGIASQNALLAAESIGLGGCYLGSLRNDVPGVIETLKLPKYVFPVVGMSIGHPDPTEGTGMKPRLPQQAVVHHDEYDQQVWRETTAAYDEQFGAYYASQGVPNAAWSKTITKRLNDPSKLDGRQHLRQQLSSQGFDSQ